MQVHRARAGSAARGRVGDELLERDRHLRMVIRAIVAVERALDHPNRLDLRPTVRTPYSRIGYGDTRFAANPRIRTQSTAYLLCAEGRARLSTDGYVDWPAAVTWLRFDRTVATTDAVEVDRRRERWRTPRMSAT